MLCLCRPACLASITRLYTILYSSDSALIMFHMWARAFNHFPSCSAETFALYLIVKGNWNIVHCVGRRYSTSRPRFNQFNNTSMSEHQGNVWADYWSAWQRVSVFQYHLASLCVWLHAAQCRKERGEFWIRTHLDRWPGIVSVKCFSGSLCSHLPSGVKFKSHES